MSRPRLAARLAAIALCGASFIATSPPDWTDMMGFDFEVLTLDATHTAVAMTGHGSTADGFDPPVLSFALSGEDTGAGCIVTAYRLEAAWAEAYPHRTSDITALEQALDAVTAAAKAACPAAAGDTGAVDGAAPPP